MSCSLCCDHVLLWWYAKYTVDLSQERKNGLWQLLKGEGLAKLKGGQVPEVSHLLQGGHTTWRRQEVGGHRLKCVKRYLQTAN